MGLQATLLTTGLVVGLTICLLGRQAGAQSTVPELVLNNSIIHSEDPPPPDVHYCFSDDDLQALANQSGVGVIVHHGKQLELPNFAATYSHSERLDFYTPQTIDPKSISLEIVRAILAGNVTNWSEIGGTDQRITVYQPSQGLKKDAIAAQLQRADIQMGVASEERPSYTDLAQALEDDPGAFVMGLRSEAAWAENLPDARRIVPVNQYGQAAFEMPIQIYVKASDPVAQASASELLSLVEARAKEDRMVFPADEKRQALGLQLGN